VVPTNKISSERPAGGSAISSSGYGMQHRPGKTASGEAGVTCILSPSQARAHVSAWEDLAAHSTEPNVFYEPHMLLEAWEEFAQETQNVRLVLVSAPVEGFAAPVLIGFFPVYTRRSYHRIPIAVVSLWHHTHCPLSTPLVRRGFEQQALHKFFEWFDSNQNSGQILLFENVAGDGPFYQNLVEYLRSSARRSFEEGRYERALLRPDGNADSYLQSALAGKRRKELRRQYNRLSELGKLELVELTPDADIDTWLRQFHELEHKGWKGRNGTSITDHENERHYFDRTSRAAFERGRLIMLALQLDGKPVAMKYNLVSGEGAFSAKIAFDEEFAQYSPGVQLEIQNIHVMHRQSDIRWMDSCAVPNHFMIERLWTERRAITSIAVQGKSVRAGMVIRGLPALLGWYRKLRRKG
jgi:CelD/BcsL family acetyltransferase involved in cellulose biosynthesis